MIQAGERAPDFMLRDQNGREHTLSEYRGKWVLLYFYPKDDTPGCTIEACNLRDSWEEFEKHQAVILGVSVDPVPSHRRFAGKYSLPFTILSDEAKQVVEAYGVWGPKKFMGREFAGTLRTSFLIDPQGAVVKVYEKVKPAGHAREVLEDLALLRATV